MIDLTKASLNIRCTRALDLSIESQKWVHEMLGPSYTPRWAEDGDGMGDAMFCVEDMGDEIEKFAAATGDHCVREDFNDPATIDKEIRSLVAECKEAGIDYVQVDEAHDDESED